MPTYTPNMGLIQPAQGEKVNIDQLNSNFDKVDNSLPTVCLSTSRPSTPYPGQMIYETDTTISYIWTGSHWRQFGSVTCTKATRPTNPPEGLLIFETDTKYLRVWDGDYWMPTDSLVFQRAEYSSTARTTLKDTDNIRSIFRAKLEKQDFPVNLEVGIVLPMTLGARVRAAFAFGLCTTDADYASTTTNPAGSMFKLYLYNEDINAANVLRPYVLTGSGSRTLFPTDDIWGMQLTGDILSQPTSDGIVFTDEYGFCIDIKATAFNPSKQLPAVAWNQ